MPTTMIQQMASQLREVAKDEAEFNETGSDDLYLLANLVEQGKPRDLCYRYAISIEDEAFEMLPVDVWNWLAEAAPADEA